MTPDTTAQDRPRYRLHRATTDASGGIVLGGIFETEGEPNEFFEPVNTAAFLRCVRAGHDPLAWRGREAAEIAAVLAAHPISPQTKGSAR
jgi:hypothetical protein